MVSRGQGPDEALLSALGENGDRIEYLFKEDLEFEEPDRWTRLSGSIYKDKLKALIETYENGSSTTVPFSSA
jgi:hypothetical protein